MITHTILCSHNGQNADTAYSAWKVWDGSVDLTKQRTVCRYYDDDGLTVIPQYKLIDKDLPALLPVEVYLRDPYGWDGALSWMTHHAPARLDAGLIELTGVYRLISRYGWDSPVFTLLTTKSFRSDFRKSCRAKIDSWLMDADAQDADFPLTSSELFRCSPPKRW